MIKNIYIKNNDYTYHNSNIKVLFLSLILLFLSNYTYKIYNSYIDILGNDTVELISEIESENNKKNDKNEKESEIEDADEYFFNSLEISQYLFNNRFNENSVNFNLLTFFYDVDSPPPIS